MHCRLTEFVALFALSAALLLPGAPVRAQAVTPADWNAYFSSQGKRAEWADMVRGEDQGALDPAALADVGTTAEGGAVPTARDRIVPAAWGIRSGKDELQVAQLLADIRAQGTVARKNAFAEQVQQLERAYTAGRVYWQVGNEINSLILARSLGKAGKLAPPYRIDDPALIPLYVEFIFAPIVEALQDSSEALYSDRKRIKVMLGTLANARRPGARAWLDTLLEYRIKGTYAAKLKDTRVADHISVIAVHYMVTADAAGWKSKFDGIATKWLGKGNIEGLWGTEEIGSTRGDSGAGAATAVRVAASYLSRAAQLQLQPSQLRCSFYGWRGGGDGRSGEYGMQTLMTHFGRTPLADVSSDLRLEGKGSLEGHAFFAVVVAANRRLAVISSRSPVLASELTAVTLPPLAEPPKLKVSAIVLAADGPRELAFAATTVGGGTRYLFTNPVRLGPGETLVLREGG